MINRYNHKFISHLRVSTLWCVIVIVSLFLPHSANASSVNSPVLKNASVPVITTYRSPQNKKRAKRKSTKFIILHTTEGAEKGALEKLSTKGECHYVVTKDGKIYTIIDRSRVAYHAGVSMWNAETGLDSKSIGIEIVGYHDKDITEAQYASVRKLLSELKRTYGVPDERVLTHSMVAYGKPNRWQKRNHRGRKRCAMLLASDKSRAKLGLQSKPSFDPDIKAKRLVDADPELTKILYAKEKQVVDVAKKEEVHQVPKQNNVIGPGRTAWDIARDLYNSSDTIYIFPDGSKKNGKQIVKWKAMPTGTKVEVSNSQEENPVVGLLEIGKDGSATELAGDEILAPTTFYFLLTGKCVSGDTLSKQIVESLGDGTKMLVGYKKGGPISAKLPVFNICGLKWDRPDTYYLDNKGRIKNGSEINEHNIPAGAYVFYQE